MKLALLLVVTLVTFIVVNADPLFDAKIDKYEKKHGLGKLTKEQRGVYAANEHFWTQHNAKRGTNDAVLGETQFAHMTNDEFRQVTGLSARAEFTKSNPLPQVATPTTFDWVKEMAISAFNMVTLASPPSAFDWRATPNIVWPAPNQGVCGSCYAIVASQAMHSAYAIKYNTAIGMPSTQQVLDCSTANNGCNGGWAYQAFQYVKDRGGVVAAVNYPYTSGLNGTTGNCSAGLYPNLMNVASYTVTQQTMSAMRTAVWARPLTITICGSSSYFQHYVSGIMTDAAACGTCSDHAVIFVGWGTTGGTPYWIMRNSWGPSWGMTGDAYIFRDSWALPNMGVCANKRYSVFPLMA